MKLQVIPYQKEWKEKFKKEKEFLLSLLRIDGLKIEHIGSTSVEGLSAKPIIDILIGVENESDLIDLQEKLQGKENYIYYQKWEPVMPFRKFFIKVENVIEEDKNQIPTTVNVGEDQPNLVLKYRGFHLHCVCTSHEFWNTHLLFRDHLREDATSLGNYENLKLELAKKEWEKSEDYSYAKADFISGILNDLKISFSPFPTLSTDSLILRALHKNDAKDFLRLRTDPEVRKFLYVDNLDSKTIYNKIDHLQKWSQEDISVFWMITDKKTKEIIGSICLWNFSKGRTKAEVGYDLMPSAQGKGIMSEALQSVLEYSKNNLPFQFIKAYTHHENEKSIQLLKRNGFSFRFNVEEKYGLAAVYQKQIK